MGTSTSHIRTDVRRYLKLTPYSEIRERMIEQLSGIKQEVEFVEAGLSLGRISAESVLAKYDIPECPISAMDGYVVRSTETSRASSEDPARFTVKGSLSPSSGTGSLSVGAGETYYVATGAPLPRVGGDAVAKVEDTRLDGEEIFITRPIPALKNVVPTGEDIQAGSVLFPKGHRFNPPDVALLLAAHTEKVKMVRQPRVGILSIGAELQKSDRVVIRPDGRTMTNNFYDLLSGFLKEHGVESTLIGICRDDFTEIRELIKSRIEEYDLILTIGGSSVGKADVTPDAVSSGEDARLVFHGVRMIPIKPAGLSLVRNKPVVVVPAHAASATFTFFLIVLPILNMISGLQFGAGLARIEAICLDGFENDRPLDAVALLRLERRGGEYYAMHLGWHSDLMSNLSRAHAFTIMNPHKRLEPLERVEAILLGSSQLERVESSFRQ